LTDAMRHAADAHSPMPAGLRLLSPLLERLRDGAVRVRWTDGREFTFGDGAGPEALVTVRDARALRRLVAAGAMGFAEGYIEGDWDTPDLATLLDLAAHNSPQRTLSGRLHFPREFSDRIAHLRRANTKRGSKRNIAAHYDLGNDFYALWLDPSMTYSCALFDASHLDLASAQEHKWDRLLGLMRPKAGETLLEIGCGWGAFAVHAAKRFDCRVVGITVSEEQYRWATRLARDEGVEHLVEIRLQDYRDVTGTFDHVASIEMLEAVGERFWPQFFGLVRQRLKPGGIAAMQTITIADERFRDYRRRPDFTRAATEAGLVPMAPTFFGHDYALTLAEWEKRFSASIAEVRGLGFDERFERIWRYYLAYCRAGFRNGMCDVMQIALR
jgi:cyclopropane-fatty-acyl-phospholipid synthase